MSDDLHTRFQPDYTPEQLENLGVYDSLYRGQGPRLASLGAWKPEWISEHDPKGWAQWYKRYSSGRRIQGEDDRQIKRWLSFKARHGGPFTKSPTPRRGWALRNWGVDPAKLVAPDQSQATTEMLDAYKAKAMQKYVAQKQANDLTKFAPKWSDRAHLLAALPQHLTDTQMALSTQGNIDKEMTDLALISQAWLRSQKQKELLAARLKKFRETAGYPSLAPSPSILKAADLNPDIKLQDHQQRIADRVTNDESRLLVYHGLGSGKSLSAIAAAEAAKKKYKDDYGVVVPAALKGNFEKEVGKFTTNSNPEIMSYTGLALGKNFAEQPDTVIMDEAHRLRNPGSASGQAAKRVARNAKNLLLLTGSPVTNSPSDLANLLGMLHNKNITPEDFEKRFIDYENVNPGVVNWFRGVAPGERAVVKNEDQLRGLLRGKIDYQPSKTPEGVNVNEEVIRVPLSPDQQKIQKAIRTKVPAGFLWKLDKEFPMSREELAKLNSFLTGMRQVSLSTQPFRYDKDPAKAFGQSSKLQTAMKNLQGVLDSDPRKKAIIYSNFIDSGLKPYSSALEKAKIPHGIFHGSIPVKQRLQALKDYNEGKLRALLLGPAAAEGISTKGTSLIQLLDPHWHESRSQQAKGRGLRFDSHQDLPEELRNVAVQRYISSSEDPSWLGKMMGYQRERTGDEVLEHLTADKERLNEVFRKILREEGSVKNSNYIDPVAGIATWFAEKASAPRKAVKKTKAKKTRRPAPGGEALAGAVGAGAAAFPLMSLHQDAFSTHPILKERVTGAPLYFADEMAKANPPIIQHGDIATYFGEPQSWFKSYKPNFSKLTQGGEWTSGTGTFHGGMLRPHNGDVQMLEGGDAFGGYDIDKKDPRFLTSPFFDFMRKRDAEDAAKGLMPKEDVGLYSLAKRNPDGTRNPRVDVNLRDVANNTSGGFFNRNFLALRNAIDGGEGDAAKMPLMQRYMHYNKHLKRQHALLQDYLKTIKTDPAARERVWGPLSERTTSPILVTRSDHMADLLRKPETRPIVEQRVNQAYRDYAYQPYDLAGAMQAGGGRVLFPKVAPQEKQLGIGVKPTDIPPYLKPTCTESYCVTPAAKTLASLGTPLGVSTDKPLPADLAAGTGFRSVGMIVPKPSSESFSTLYGGKKFKTPQELYGNDAPAELTPKQTNTYLNDVDLQPETYKEDYRKKVLNWMEKSRNRRIATGVLAAAALGAGGYGATKLVQRWMNSRKKKRAKPSDPGTENEVFPFMPKINIPFLQQKAAAAQKAGRQA